jgi:hypothetical protein
MNISVQGLRTSSTDWEAVKNIPEDQLPPLTPQQREVARKMGIPEGDYARSALAGQRTMEKMFAKTERFARYLMERLREIAPQASVESVILNTWDGRFEVSVAVGNRSVPIRIAEEIVDDYFDSGSPEMGQRLDHVLSLAIHAQVA